MTPSPSTRAPAPLRGLLPRMCCPSCGDSLGWFSEALRCGGCDASFPVRDGIPLLAIHGTTETWGAGEAGETSAEYQREYAEVEEARKYNEAYRDRATKRWSTRRELRILDELLGRRPRAGVLLDIPSGGGRLSERLAPRADLLVEADIALGQVRYGRDHAPEGAHRMWMTASAFHVPFRDGAVDGVVCCRLCHHLPTLEERERLVAELLRVSKDFVVMTFFDHHSVKNYIRRARRPFDGQPPKMTMTIRQVRDLAREHGAELAAWPALSRLFSGHRYALMVKR